MMIPPGTDLPETYVTDSFTQVTEQPLKQYT